ncbi:MAG: glycoside hydrolase family 92 protein [Bacteroidetes bacterium]|nr:MAG: glycoside hydrolase family 92 protein [Bacteroidota bacterium]
MHQLKILLLLFLLWNFTACTNQEISEPNSFVDDVNTFIGTTGDHPTSYGGTIPSVAPPFAMTQWSPMTRKNEISKTPYHYNDTTLIGFIGTHQPAIWMGDYGFVSLMPQVDVLETTLEKRGYAFSHQDEQSSPYAYSVKFHSDKGKTISTNIQATTRCGKFEITYPESENAYLVIDASRLQNFEGWIKIDPEKNEVIGYNPDRHSSGIGPELPNFKGYFVIQIDKPFDHFGTYSDTIKMKDQLELTGENIGGYLKFKTRENEKVTINIATSFISIEQARENLQKEKGSFDSTKDDWNNLLNRIEIEGGTQDQRISFYTAMFHCLQYPRLFSEHGQYYSAFDDTIHSGVSYNDYSLWDTYRALHPLLIFITPEHVNPMMQSLIQMYDEGGWIPKWPNPTYSNIMIGTHADAVLVDAYTKGFDGFDIETAYEAMYKNAMTPPLNDSLDRWWDRGGWTAYEARGGLSYYKKLGFVPIDRTNEAVSRTIEFSYGDYCVAQMAKALDKQEDYDYFIERSKNYRNTYNPATGFMAPRNHDGTFHPDPEKGFTEGSPWTYNFGAMHDVAGMIELMGGEQPFIEKLNENFDGQHYRHGNEPGHHYAYLYNYAGQPWKTQELVREILDEKYLNKPDGLCGNDDCGQMSAWYIFSAMGFYPVSPGSLEYAIGAPLFKKVTLKLDRPGKKDFVIEARNYGEQNIYVKSVTLDGKKLVRPFIQHSDIMNGELLVFEMDSIAVR